MVLGLARRLNWGALLVVFILAACARGGMVDRSPISVSKNVQVSAGRSNVAHVEVVMAADPSNAKRLMACSFAWSGGGVLETPAKDAAPEFTIAYVSHDGGLSWNPSVMQQKGSWDPDCVYDRDGRAYFVSGTVQGRSASMLMGDSSGRWNRHFNFVITDRPWVSVFGKDEVALGLIPGPSSHPEYPNRFFRVSYDGGAHFGPPLTSYYNGRTFKADDNSNHPVFLSDGTLLAVLADFTSDCSSKTKFPPFHFQRAALEIEKVDRSATKPNDCIYAARLKPHADSLQVSPIATQYRRGGTIESMAVDPGSRYFKDRAYVTWSDDRTGRQRIYIVHSADGGLSWSAPQTVDDEPWGRPLAQGPDNVAPSVAVNREGVVLVTWEDRRDNPDDVGYYLRAAASFDGGQSWSPSVRVSEAPNTFLRDDSIFGGVSASVRGEPAHVTINHRVWETEGHTLGLAADTTGVFHPLWVDDRTGIPQVWTAQVAIVGTVTKHGAPELDALDDVTDSTKINLYDAGFNRGAGTAWAVLQVKNTSKHVLSNVKVRLLSTASAFAFVAPANPIVSFSGTLAPGATTPPQRIEVRLADLRPEQDGDLSIGWSAQTGTLLDLQLRVFAAVSQH